MPRNTTKSHEADDRLTPQQQTAIDLLTTGKTLTDTAHALEVDRATVSTWVNHSPVFIAGLHSRRQELWEGQVETLRGLLPKALAVLQQALEGDNPFPAAIQVLKSCGLAQGLGRPQGPATVEEAERAVRQREIEQACTALTEADVQAAVRQREQTRLLAELTTFS
jgi:hypothetical protein